MTYTLELNHYNPTENLFFQATNIATPAQFTEYITPILDKHKAKGTWTDNTAWGSRTFDRYQREGTGWQLIVRINHFVSVAVAVEFFKRSSSRRHRISQITTCLASTARNTSRSKCFGRNGGNCRSYSRLPGA